MGERTKRGVVKTGKALEKLSVGRDGAIQVCREAKINTPEFKAANHVVDSIDDLAASLTGNDQHFHTTGHGSALMPMGDDDRKPSPAEEFEALCSEFGVPEAVDIAASELAKVEDANDAERTRHWRAVLECFEGIK